MHFDSTQPPTAASNRKQYREDPKFRLNLPRVERRGADCNPWLAKMTCPGQNILCNGYDLLLYIHTIVSLIIFPEMLQTIGLID
jgi:hypothetical protein